MERHIPIRMCVICRKRLPKNELARFTARKGEPVLADPNRNMPGRGCYICPSPSCRAKFEAGLKRKSKGVAHE